MRIALIGDLQYAQGEENQIREYLRQVNGIRPDLAVFMGDMGCHGKTGTEMGMRACRDFLAALDCPTAVLMGNHDVEYRPDDTEAREPERWYAELFGREHPWQAVEAGGTFLLCLSVERQPADTLHTQHALYASDEQYEWAKAQLADHRDWPTIVFSHAPVAGSGLRCFPPIHSAATDAHMDHTFNALRWRHLLADNPQIRLWCSAHFHMGHDYRAAIVRQGDMLHVSAGVLTSAARDGSRHTRVIDLADGRAAVCTLDHHTDMLRQDAAISMAGELCPEGRMAERCADEMLLGMDRVRAAYGCPDWNRAYVLTEAGRLWEYDRELQEISGAIRLNRTVRALAMEGSRLYVAEESGSVFSVERSDAGRFERLSGFLPQAAQQEGAMQGELLQKLDYDVREAREGTYLHLKF